MKFTIKQCSCCEKDFLPTGGKQKFCSSKCFNKIKSQKVMLRRKDPKVQEQYNAQQRKWRADNKEHCSEWYSVRYKNNTSIRERKKAASKQYFYHHYKQVREKQLQYYLDNYEKFAAKNLSRHTRRFISPELIVSILSEGNYTCVYCGKYGGRLTIDHKLAVVRGGGDERSNLCVACKSCNSSKGRKTPEEFAKYKLELANACLC